MTIHRGLETVICCGAIAALLAAPSASAIQCGDTIDQSTTLTADVVCPDAFAGAAITIGADNVVLDGGGKKIVVTCCFGVRADRQSGLTIRNLNLAGTGGGTGIFLRSSNNSKVLNNDLSGRYNALHLEAGSNNLVDGNNASQSAEWAIRVSSQANLTLRNNNLSGSQHGLLLSDTDDFILDPTSGNDFSAIALTAVLVESSSGVTVRDLKLAGSGSGTGTGIFLRSTNDSKVLNNDLSGRYNALHLEAGSNNLVEGNNASQSAEWAIRVSSQANLSLRNNDLSGSQHGLLLSQTNDFILDPSSGNDFSAITLAAVLVESSTGVTVRDLELAGSGSGTGLWFRGGSGNTVSGVRLRGWDSGLMLEHAAGSAECLTIAGNLKGVYAGGAAGFPLTRSSFDNNASAVTASGTAFTARSNYWGAPDGPAPLGGSGQSYAGPVNAQPFLQAAPGCLGPQPAKRAGAGPPSGGRAAGDGDADDQFGWSVAIAGDVAIVGARNDDGARGAAYLLARDQGGAGAWGQLAKLTASDGKAGDELGYSVAISGDTLVVGAYAADSSRGAAYVFARKSGAWGEVRRLTASDGKAGDSFGRSVGISGDTLVVGADNHANTRGAAYVFSRDRGGAGAWGQAAKLIAADGEDGDSFGWSVAIAGQTALVGARGDDGSRGAAYLFSRDQGGAGAWGQVKKLTAAGGSARAFFGYSVAVSGPTAVVGAHASDGLRGAAYVFSRDPGAGGWSEVKKLTAADGAARDFFGAAVAVAGDTVVVGARGHDFGADADQGAAYLFSRDHGGAGAWGQVKKLSAPNGAAGDKLGAAVAVSGGTTLAGAWGRDHGAGKADQGIVYVFQ